jgi:translation initiation factor IF-3
VLLIDETNEKVGVVETIEALRRAHSAGLDLVEVSSDATPPVCRILDFGKYKYELAKKEKASKAKSKTTEMKEVRLGRSMKIDPHDVGIRVNQAHAFLLEGHKVLIVQNFRGRELQHKHLGDARMKAIIEKLSDVAKVETPPRLNGRRMAMILTPDKAKIDALQRRAGGSAPAAKPAASSTAADDAASHAPAPDAQQAAAAPASEAKPQRKPAKSRSDSHAEPKTDPATSRGSRAVTAPTSST